jgi:hypothetical protein
MSCLNRSPPERRALREFLIRCDKRGRWVATETHGHYRGVFHSCKDALRFALYEAHGDAARVEAGQPIEIAHR